MEYRSADDLPPDSREMSRRTLVCVLREPNVATATLAALVAAIGGVVAR